MAELLDLYNDNVFSEASLLRSILVFNDVRVKTKRNDMMLKALYALILEGDNSLTISDITRTIKERFCLNWSDTETKQKINQLRSIGLVNITEAGQVKICEYDNRKRSFTRNVMEETNSLISRIEEKLRSAYNGLIPNNINVRNTIKKALSAYFRHSGLELIGLKKGSTKEETINAIDCIKNDMQGNHKLAELLIRILAETLHNPIREDKLILEKWARAYIAMQIIGLDPILSNFKESKLSGKSFIFDTDVVLNCLTNYALNSKDYRIMLDKLKSIGCKIYIPEDVIHEAEKHCKTALYKFNKYGNEQIMNLSDELLEQEISNVFIEDYVKMIRANPDKSDLTFDAYIDNYFDKSNHYLFYSNLSDIFTPKNLQNKLPDLIDSERKVNELKKLILSKTEMSRKGEQRSTEVNEVLSEADAILYLTICEMNSDCDNGNFFANKAYLLTGMKKGIRSARELGNFNENIICHPRALLSILMENGLIHSDKINIINLMDNPFLVYTAKQIWSDVEPLIQAGAKLKYAELNKLRIDVDTKIDKILTCNSPEERYEESKRLADNGYFFGQDIINATEKAKSLEEEMKSKDVSIAQKDKTIEEQLAIIKSQEQLINKLKEKEAKLNAKEKYETRIGLKQKKLKKR